MSHKDLLASIVAIAKEAGKAIIPFYGKSKQLAITQKSDNTPLTLADLKANDIIQQRLKELTPEIPVLSEEGDIPDYKERCHWEKLWMVDPLDGTRGFVDHSAEFTVNIALIDNHQSVLGVIYAPISTACYYALQGGPAYFQIEESEPQVLSATKPFHWSMPKIVVGKYHRSKRLKSLIDEFGEHELIRLNSSLKLCAVASGKADIYPRLGPTHEWDTAAGQCILEAVGGEIVAIDGTPLQYNARKTLANPEFLAVGDPKPLDQLIEIFKKLRSAL